MGQLLKRKKKVTVMLLIEKQDGALHRRTIGPTLVQAVSIVFFLLVVVVVCKLTYDTITLKHGSLTVEYEKKCVKALK
ncbi:MAG: hypothetical protein OSJ60_13650, partial [Lachnospiraceae bacterium]|nr:hypothetical protein [Lachnospiraceae bacterium]